MQGKIEKALSVASSSRVGFFLQFFVEVPSCVSRPKDVWVYMCVSCSLRFHIRPSSEYSSEVADEDIWVEVNECPIFFRSLSATFLFTQSLWLIFGKKDRRGPDDEEGQTTPEGHRVRPYGCKAHA